MNRLGEFYLCILQPLKIWAKNQGPTQSNAVIALDSGVRTFITGYDPSGQAVEWGKNDISRIYQLSHIYDKIQSTHDSIYGKFKTQGIVRRGKRRIRSKTARMMLTWSHFQFRQYLLHKVREYPWCRIIICTEEYTMFRYPSCTTELDRDINGARFAILPLHLKSRFMLALGPTPWDLHEHVYFLIGHDQKCDV
ncbi:hypothetical protein Glove_441g69 [Diversispora epigaea]|uniref:Uncharacterized protein n=1 Tax=Diversispora epigaea TaxID=1348612 RepID=A0A397GV81_9GLOM|nr:hypothetical protein Glove_441g69 [Diversispora epigaea]